MPKSLSEMSLEELWRLFPIYLTEHQDIWSKWYEEEVNILKSILHTEYDLKFNHIGSTAIHGIWAKPIIDILIEAPKMDVIKIIKEKLIEKGYICMSNSGNRISFNKGYTEMGFAEKVYHIHLRLMNDNDEIYFREFLNMHPEIANEYEKLKISLWKKYEYDRDKYTMSKSEFVTKYTKIAKDFLTCENCKIIDNF